MQSASKFNVGIGVLRFPVHNVLLMMALCSKLLCLAVVFVVEMHCSTVVAIPNQVCCKDAPKRKRLAPANPIMNVVLGCIIANQKNI